MKNKMKNKITTLTIVTVFSILTACSDSALDKLKKDSRDPNISSSFWSKEAKNDSNLWKDAVKYCQTHKEKPNCSPVNGVYTMHIMIQNSSTEAPPYGSQPEEDIKLPF